MADTEKKVAKLQKKLDKIDRKIHTTGTGTEYHALLIDRRDIEEKLWALGAEVRVY